MFLYAIVNEDILYEYLKNIEMPIEELLKKGVVHNSPLNLIGQKTLELLNEKQNSHEMFLPDEKITLKTLFELLKTENEKGSLS